MSPILTLAAKELRLLRRDKFALFWVLAFPLMYALFFGSVFGGSGDGGRGAISLVVVDEDRSDLSGVLVETLAKNESVAVARVSEEENAAFELLDLDAAKESVQKGRRAAYLRIPAGYGENPYAMFGAGGDRKVELEIGIDPGRSAEAGFLQGVLMEAMFGVMQERFTDGEALSQDLGAAKEKIAQADDLSAPQKLVLQTFLGAVEVFGRQFEDVLGGKGHSAGSDADSGEKVEAPSFSPGVHVVDVTRDLKGRPRNPYDITMPQALVWGLMSVAMSFAISLVRERSAGTLRRLLVSPVSAAQLLAGKALGCFCACLATMSLLLVFGTLALGVRVDDFLLLVLAMASTAVCFTGIMMTASNLGRTEAAVAGSSWGLMMPFAMIGGGMIPLIAMPKWLVAASKFSFFSWAIRSVEGALWRGFTLADMLGPCAVLLAIGAAFFTLGVVLFRRSLSG